MSDKPQMVDDGLAANRNVTVYVCDADDAQEGGYDVHLNVGENQFLEHICFDCSASLTNRATLAEAWQDAADWLRETAKSLCELRLWINENMDWLGDESDSD